jgi:hypothetical protein
MKRRKHRPSTTSPAKKHSANPPAPPPGATFLTRGIRHDTAPPVAVSPKPVLEVQRRLTEENSTHAAISAMIRETEEKIGKLKGGIPSPPDYARKREDLLAAIATGEGTPEDLATLDREAAEAQEAYDSGARRLREEISPLEATIAGLKRKAAHHAAEIDRLRAEHRCLSLDLLMARCEDAGQDYAEAVCDAIAAMERVVVLASLHKRAGGENFIGDGIDQFNAPPLGTTSSRATTPPMDSVAFTRRLDAAEEEILTGLRAEGVALVFPGAEVPAPRPEKPSQIPFAIARPPEDLRTGSGHIAPVQAVSEFNPYSSTGE